MIAGVLKLSRKDVLALGVRDAYSLHRIVYGLFDDVRSNTDKKIGASSGFLFADKGGTATCRQILFLSNRAPGVPQYGELRVKQIPESFLDADDYTFEVVVNPVYTDAKTKKRIPVKGSTAIGEWFVNRAASWGFSVAKAGLEVKNIKVQQFEKKGSRITLEQALIQGHLHVTDRKLFKNSFEHGIGKGRAFGCGLLQIVPIFY